MVANSFHPNPDRSDRDLASGTSTATAPSTAAAPTRSVRVPLPQRYGTYNVTLRVTDDLGRRSGDGRLPGAASTRATSPPVARTSQRQLHGARGRQPAASTAAASSDANVACGDAIVGVRVGRQRRRRLRRRRHRHDRQPRPVVPWAVLNTLRKWADPVTGLPNNTVTLRVRDDLRRRRATVNATVTIYQAAPIAGGRAVARTRRRSTW
jgi:hypothetical protein